MKKVISILVIAVMLVAGLFVLTGCGNNETTGGSSSSGKSNDSSNWMEAYNMSNLKVPEGATVEEGFSYSSTDKQIKRDTEFTDDEIDIFAQSVFENCNGAYKSKYNSETNQSEKATLQNAKEAKGDDEYLWKYEDNGVTYAIRIYFGTRDSLRFEKYQS